MGESHKRTGCRAASSNRDAAPHLAVAVQDAHCACRFNFKSSRVAPILLGFAGHQTNVGNVAHGGNVKLPVLFAVIDEDLVNAYFFR